MLNISVDSKSINVDVITSIITPSDIYNELNCLKSTTYLCPDSIPNVFFTNCKFELSIRLLYIFNIPLMSAVFPNKWKMSYVLTFHKGNDICLVNNYHLINITSIIPKMFENIVHKNIFFLFKHIIAVVQHGFVLGKSTTTNLLVFQNYVLKAFKSDFQVDIYIFTDFFKAFNKVDYIAISSKLFNLGIHDHFLS